MLLCLYQLKDKSLTPYGIAMAIVAPAPYIPEPDILSGSEDGTDDGPTSNANVGCFSSFIFYLALLGILF